MSYPFKTRQDNPKDCLPELYIIFQDTGRQSQGLSFRSIHCLCHGKARQSLRLSCRIKLERQSPRLSCRVPCKTIQEIVLTNKKISQIVLPSFRKSLILSFLAYFSKTICQIVLASFKLSLPPLFC